MAKDVDIAVPAEDQAVYNYRAGFYIAISFTLKLALSGDTDDVVSRGSIVRF